MLLSRCLNLATKQALATPARCITSKTPPAKMSLALRGALLDEADPQFRTRYHDAVYEAREILKKSPNFKATDTVVVPEKIDLTPLGHIPEEQLCERTVRIYLPTKAATQSGTYGVKWRIEMDNQQRWENPLMGWASSGDCLSNLTLEFPTAETAVQYCEDQGWSYFLEEAKQSVVKGKNYASNFSWNKRTRRGCK